MYNRLHFIRRLSMAVLLCCLFPWASQLNAQCSCTPVFSGDSIICTGPNFTLIYEGPDTFYVGSSCLDTLVGFGSSVKFLPAPTGVNFSAALTGYSIGAMIPSNTTVTIHYIVSGGGDIDTLCFPLVFVDNVPPQMNYSPMSESANCGSANFTDWWEAQRDSIVAHATDNCSVDTVYHSLSDTIMDNCGTFTDTFFVEDVSGNLTFAVATYTITDNTSPTLSGVPADTLIICSEIVPPPPTVTGMDACAGVVPVIYSADTTAVGTGACADFNYNILRKWRASDGCGNMVESIQTIQVRDTIKPTFDIPVDMVLDCPASIDTADIGSLTNVLDNCSSFLTMAMTDNMMAGACPVKDSLIRTWTVTDACGNITMKSQMILVQDTIAPTFDTFPGDMTLDCSANPLNMAVTGMPVPEDECDTPTMSNSDVLVSGLCPHSYTINRSWTISDGCNTVDSLQVITVTDMQAPVVNNAASGMTIACDDNVDADDAFNTWVATHGAATATDNCSNTDSLVWEAYNAGTTDPASLAAPNCINPTIGVYRSRTVNFVVTDECGRRDTTTATFTVADNTPPVLTMCPTDIIVTTDLGVCESVQPLRLPMVAEECGNTTTLYNLTETQALTYPGGDPIETPVDDLVFDFSVPGPPLTATGSATLVVSLFNVDAEAPTEFFNVYGEDGSLLGTTIHTPTQCGNATTSFTLTNAQLNDWAFDGTVTITVKPNIPVGQPGRFSVNPICPGGEVKTDLNFSADNPDGLKFEYSINGGTRIPVVPVLPTSDVFAAGTSAVTYYITDCAGNESTCSFNITVEDKEAPVIDCPPSSVVNLLTGECSAQVEVPLFSSITDNCGVTVPTVQDQPTAAVDRLITYSYNPNIGDFVADDKSFTFSGLQGNATPGNVQLIVTIQGDVDSSGAYYEIYDQNNNFLGTTANGQGHVTPGDCNTPSTAVFQIDYQTFNDWASAGDIQFTAVSYMGYPIPPAGPGWGINPCDTSLVHNDGDMDGSFIYATISYESIAPLFSATGATTIAPVTLNPPLQPTTYTLAQGETHFNYKVTDLAGNDGECAFTIEVRDTEAPTVLCGPTFVDINPSGFVNDTIFPAEIDLGSTDNCTIASMTVSPNIITCNSPSTVNVTLTVTDASGNVSTCNTFVGVTTIQPTPTAVSNCGSTSLQLFTNPPATPGGGANAFQYTWYTPAGIPFAFVKDPVIQNASISDLGFYIVQIQGITGCTSIASVQVTCDLLPLQKPVVSTSNTVICAGDPILLTTPAVCGTTVQYKWYSGTAPGGMLLATTALPSFTMMPPASGTFNFYVVVERNSCDSEASNTMAVQVKTKPTAMPSQSSFIVCEGEQVLLNSINNPNGATCHWTGPCGYESFSCSPAPISNAVDCNSGMYQLVVSDNGCDSEPAFVSVNVVAKPQTPSVSNTTTASSPACDGTSITLTATAVSGAISYQWTTPSFTTISTPTNVLSISTANMNQHAGQWTVTAIGNPCESDVSQITTVYMVPAPQAISAAANPNQVCEGQDIQLSASSASQNVSYLWTFPSGQTDALQNPLLEEVSNTDNGTYTLIVTSQFGCTATTSVAVTVLDRVDITGISSDAPNCASGPVNVHLAATLFPMDSGTYQYLWTGPGGFSSTNASATISNGTVNQSGPYTLVVTNAAGCSSLPSTVNVAIPPVLPTPTAPVLSTFNPFCEGNNVTLTTSAYQGPNVAYQWTTPTGVYTTNSPSLPISDLTVADAGDYTVQYVYNDCPSGMSGSVQLIINPTPVIQPVSNSPVCEGQVLELSIACTAGSTYEWTGPSGFSSSVCNPIISNASPSLHSGTYSVRKRVGGCWSDVVAVNVAVKPKPVVPTAINVGPYCGSTDDVIVSVTQNSATPGATYAWYDQAGNLLGTPTPSLNFTIPNAGQYGNGSVPFYVIASLDGCPSTASVPTTVSLNSIPANLAEAGTNVLACEGDVLMLQATAPTVGTGVWTIVGGNPTGVTIANPDAAATTVSGITPGENYMFQWTLSNGACEDYSDDQAAVFVNIVEDANAGDPITACFATTVNLSAVMPVSNIGTWSQPTSQAALGVTIVDASNPNTLVTGLVPGPGNNYIFTWTIDGGCGTSSDAVVVNVTNESAFAGTDFLECGDGCSALTAVAALSGNGSWSSPNPAIEIVTPTDASTTICNLQPGANILVWTINDGICGHYSVDSVLINYRLAPQATDDELAVGFDGEASVDVTLNDQLPIGNYALEIIAQPVHGEVSINQNGRLTYKADLNFVGFDFAIYQICLEDCDCSTATVTFNVGEDAKCVAPSIITPNQDGINDAFIVPCLSSALYPKNNISIFNQWGDEVFEARPYQNNWEGTFDGEDLPAGTYFYILDLGNGDQPMSGYLVIQR